MGYEDVIYRAMQLGVIVDDLIEDLNSTQYYSDSKIVTYLIISLLNGYSNKTRKEILEEVSEYYSIR